MKNLLTALVVTGAMLTGCSPTEYEVAREITIDAPAAVVFEQVNNHRNRDAWSPWEQMDPNMVKGYAGPDAGVGSVYTWEGNDSVGSGSLEILESQPHQYIKSKLVFTSPWESTSIIEWHFSEEDGSTRAEWKVMGELPGYLFWMNEGTMEEMMGPDFENGLALLKEVSENAGPMAGYGSDFEMVKGEVEAHTYYFVEVEMSMDEMDMKVFDEGYQKIFQHLGEESTKVKQPPMGIYHVWDEETQRTAFEVAVICDSEKPGSEEVKRGKTYAGEVVMCAFTGPYELTGEVHEAMHEYIEDNNLQFNGSPWESYVVGPGEVDNPDEYQTVIYYPVTGALAQAE